MDMLTENAIKTLYDNDGNQSLNNCQVQLINFRSIESSTAGSARYRAIISDGTHFMQAMLVTKHTSQIESGHLMRYSIIRIIESVVNIANGRKIIILLDFEIVTNNPLVRVGNPVSIEGVKVPGPLSSSAGVGGGAGRNTQASFQQPIQQPFQQTQQSTTQPIQLSLQQQVARPIQQQQSPRPILQPQTSQQPPLFMQNSGTSYAPEPSNKYPESSLFPINCLNPYRNKWTIKARVIQKSDIKTWANSRTEGKLFSVNLLDKTGEIKATAFQKEVDRFYPMLVEGQVYYISNARVVVAKKQFSTLNNEYELSIDYNTQVELCTDDPSIPSVNYSFTKIADMDQKETNSTVDVLGVVRQDGGVVEIIAKSTGAPIKKRELSIVDETQKEINVTIWGRSAELFDSSGFPVVAFKGLRVSEFGGRNLSLQNSGTIKMNPNIPEAHKLQSWYRGHGQQAAFSSLSNTVSYSEVSQIPTHIPKMTIGNAKFKCNIGERESVYFFAVRGTIMFIKTESYSYPACPECRKKLVFEDNLWRCEKCSLVHNAPDYKYVLAFTIEDETSQLYVTAFDKVAEQLLQKSANQMAQLRDSFGFEHLHMGMFDPPKYRAYNFKIKAHQRVYNDLPNTQYLVVEATPVDFVKEGEELVAAIDLLMA